VRAVGLMCPIVIPIVIAATLIAIGCHPRGSSGPRVMPTPSVQVGACGDPSRDGVIGTSPNIDHADRDLDGDGALEPVAVDRSMCTGDGNCYWNVFVRPKAGGCSRYSGTIAAAALELLATKGEDGMTDVRGYWNLHGSRLLLQTYRFVRGGYEIVDTLLCKRAADDKLECADSDR